MLRSKPYPAFGPEILHKLKIGAARNRGIFWLLLEELGEQLMKNESLLEEFQQQNLDWD